MIGFLRFVGMLNAAVWLGAAAFFTIGAAPALVSQDMVDLLGAKLFPYLSGAVVQIVVARYYHFHLVCALIALLHLAAEGLYMGRTIRKPWLGLLAGLFAVSLLGSLWLSPKLARLHRAQYILNASPQDHVAAARSFRIWHGVFQGINVFMIAGVAVCFWYATERADELRFVGTTKFRS